MEPVPDMHPGFGQWNIVLRQNFRPVAGLFKLFLGGAASNIITPRASTALDLLIQVKLAFRVLYEFGG
ncbi:MAG: hypothetical protein M0Z43_09720 [Acidithiobacillus sp.]|nr:hypothetical protein [Acidithiobacillus sp.]